MASEQGSAVQTAHTSQGGQESVQAILFDMVRPLLIDRGVPLTPCSIAAAPHARATHMRLSY